MSQLRLKLTLTVLIVIHDSSAQFNAGGGASGSIGGSGSSSSSGSVSTGGSESETGAGNAPSTPKSSACWMRAEDFLNNFNGPQGWELNQPVYAEQHDCSQDPDPSCIGIKKFYPETDTRNSNSWENKKILYYPFGLVNWADLSTAQSNRRPLIIGENGSGAKMRLCRHLSGFQQNTIGTHTEGESNCVMKSGETGEQITRATFETLVITSSGDNSGLDQNVMPCSRIDPDSCNENLSIRLISADQPPESTESISTVAPYHHIAYNTLCWLQYTVNRFDFLAGEPIGIEGTNLVFLVRVIYPGNHKGKVAFGKLLFPQQKIYVIGCDAPVSPDYAAVEVLGSPFKSISWKETNSTELRCGFPDYTLILGEIPGKAYAMGKRSRSHHTVCQPEIGQDRRNTILLGMVNSEAGYCETVFKGHVVHYNKFWIPMQTQQRKGMITHTCPAISMTGGFDSVKHALLELIGRYLDDANVAANYMAQYQLYPYVDTIRLISAYFDRLVQFDPAAYWWDLACSSDDLGVIMKFDGYSLVCHSKFHLVSSDCLNEFKRCETYATYQD